MVHPGLLHQHAKTFGQGLQPLDGRVVDQNNEFLPSPAAGDVERPERCGQGFGDYGQNTISHMMAPGVVDVFEVVDVYEQDAERHAAFPHALVQALQGDVGIPSVAYAGKRVGQRFFAQLFYFAEHIYASVAYENFCSPGDVPTRIAHWECTDNNRNAMS
eukprot:TRINITY_DN23001_c0_g1_i1.p2 TRINITY_DN23001_c0_g1~~TRINITY_DN23001_c0_g1_i1.p2  ORF type:complete len:160 (+),score=18.51 TRINITY_DN23001_c0_g1_i1:324-803(+)